MRFYQMSCLHLLWLAPVLLFALWLTARWRMRTLERLASARLLREIVKGVQPSRRRWQAGLFVLGFIALVIALTRPAWNPKPKTVERWGRDVVFVLDVSRSMLAQDLRPSRLERAKLAIGDVLEILSGDRVALVAFAGTAVVKCPLTLDYGFFEMALNNLTPGSISRGGSMIGDAIRTALDEVFDDEGGKYRDIVLITDGEDHDSFPVEAAKAAGNRKVRILAIGLGDEDEGKRIPVEDTKAQRAFLTYQGREIWSKLDADTLRKIVNVSFGGKYFGVATGTIDLGTIYQELIAEAEQRKVESLVIKQYEEKFQIFLLLAFVFLLTEILLEINPGLIKLLNRWKKPALFVVLIVSVFANAATPCRADSPADCVKKGNRLFAVQDFVGALGHYKKADTSGLVPEVKYNMATAFLAQENLEEAARLYREAAERTESSGLKQKIHYNLGTVTFQEAKRQTDSDLKKAVKSLEESAGWFRAVLDANPEDSEARHNLEVVRLVLKDLLDRLKDQQSQQDENKNSQDQQQQQNQESEQQQGDDQQNQEDQQKQDGQEPEGEQDEKSSDEQEQQQVAVPEVTPEDIVREEEDRKQERARVRGRVRAVDRDW